MAHAASIVRRRAIRSPGDARRRQRHGASRDARAVVVPGSGRGHTASERSRAEFDRTLVEGVSDIRPGPPPGAWKVLLGVHGQEVISDDAELKAATGDPAGEHAARDDATLILPAGWRTSAQVLPRMIDTTIGADDESMFLIGIIRYECVSEATDGLS